MKVKLLLISALLMIFLSGCDKEDGPSSSSLSTWKPSEQSTFATSAGDYGKVDIFSAPWVGTVSLNGFPVDFGEMKFLADNVLFIRKIYSDKISFELYANSVVIAFNGKTFVLENSFTVDLIKGTFIAKGVAWSESESIIVDVSLKVQESTTKKPN